MSSTVRFKAPVRIGDTVTATVKVREIDVAKKREPNLVVNRQD